MATYNAITPDEQRTIAGALTAIRAGSELTLNEQQLEEESDLVMLRAWLTAYDNGQIPSFETVYESDDNFWRLYDDHQFGNFTIAYFEENTYRNILEEKSQLEAVFTPQKNNLQRLEQRKVS